MYIISIKFLYVEPGVVTLLFWMYRFHLKYLYDNTHVSSWYALIFEKHIIICIYFQR